MEETQHRIVITDSKDLSFIHDSSIALVVTSPPYPMIEMWDDLFRGCIPGVAQALDSADGNLAFSLMHAELDRVWDEVFRVLIEGGLACINIGDATRTVGKRFRLYSNHARILTKCMRLGFDVLPAILWRKPTNAPNKYMGSGMLPAGAYVTLEHEYILILRKGPKREFKTEAEKEKRRRSALFWEERNTWFSDFWDLKGVRQVLDRGPGYGRSSGRREGAARKNSASKGESGGGRRGRGSVKESRKRSAAFPFELAFRLINMYSVRADTVLDPFLGTGTSMHAAMASGRNSIGVEIDDNLPHFANGSCDDLSEYLNHNTEERLRRHETFIERYATEKGNIKHRNERHGFNVITSQEKKLEINFIERINRTGDSSFRVVYAAQWNRAGPLWRL